MKFLGSLTPADINKLCKECKVKVQITATIDDGVILTRLPNGDIVTETYEQVVHQSGQTIRSWNDLFQVDNKYAIFLNDKERKSLK